MKKLLIGFYALTLSLYIPALLTNYLGVCPALALGQSCTTDFWDFYESTFVVIALLDFIPFFLTVELLSKPKVSLYHVAFMITGAWMLIMAMPDIYASYVPWIGGTFSDYQAYWFGDVSFALLLQNLYFFIHLSIFSPIVKKVKEQ